MWVERPCRKCWHYHPSLSSQCRHPKSERPEGGFNSITLMRMSDREHCSPEGRYWLLKPPFLLPRLKFWFMSRKKKYQWSQAVEALIDKPSNQSWEGMATPRPYTPKPIP